MENATPTKIRGRPRQFDKELALDEALNLFMEKGYEATSLTDITNALGINRPSVYAAFGNKEELFSQVLARYNLGPVGYLKQALAEKTSRLVVRKMLMKSVELLTNNPEQPRGCLAIQSSISSELASVGIQQKIVEALHESELNIKNRFSTAIAEDDLPVDADAWILTKYVTTIHKGLSIQASNGSCKEELAGVENLFLNLGQENKT